MKEKAVKSILSICKDDSCNNFDPKIYFSSLPSYFWFIVISDYQNVCYKDIKCNQD